MENASKALIMAAGLLIGIAIISLGVYLFATFGAMAADTNKQVEQQQMEQFNSKYTSYQGKGGLTIYDVVTVANMAKENNLYYGYTKITDKNDAEKNSYIQVIVANIDSATSGKNIEQINDFTTKISDETKGMKDEAGEKVLHNYICTNVIISNYTNRVYKIIFVRDDKQNIF